MFKKILLWFIIPLSIFCFFGIIGFNYFEYKISDIINLGMFFLTYFLVIFAWESLKKSRKESYLESRPYLIGDFELEKGVLFFYVLNSGKTPAIGVKISVDPDILILDELSFNHKVFKNTIAFFPPKKIVKTIINRPSQFHEKYNEIKLKITYKDSMGKPFEEIFHIDLSYRKGLLYFNNKDIGDLVKSLNEIRSSLDQLKNNNNSSNPEV